MRHRGWCGSTGIWATAPGPGRDSQGAAVHRLGGEAQCRMRPKETLHRWQHAHEAVYCCILLRTYNHTLCSSTLSLIATDTIWD